MRTMLDSRWSLRKKRFIIFLLIVISFFSIFSIYCTEVIIFLKGGMSPTIPETMHLAVVSCGRPNYQGVKDFTKPLDLSLTMIKSAAMFAKSPLHIHIFTEDEMKDLFEGEIETWPEVVKNRVEYSIYPADYSLYLPKHLIGEWQRWYKPCGSFRLLLPMILKDITDAAIYSDADVVFVKPIDELWAFLKQMQPREVAAISPTAGHPIEASESNENFISHPSGLYQINSGIMVMNFTRIREADWKMFHDADEKETITTEKYGVDLLLSYYKKYKDKAEHDQKLLNIMYHFNPDLLHQLPCSWNFKNNFCTDDSNVCSPAEENGAGAVHGISGAFFGVANPTFKGLYESFLEYNMGEDLQDTLYRPYLAKLVQGATGTYCGEKSHVITDSLRESLQNVDFGKTKGSG